MKSGLRDRNNDEAGYGTRYMNASLSQWSPVLETGTIRELRRMRAKKQDVSMKSGLRDRNNASPRPATIEPTRCLNEVRS